MHNTLKALNEGPFMTHTANELLFEGWSLDPYLPIIQLVNSTILHGKVPTLPENLRFGFYFGVTIFSSLGICVWVGWFIFSI